MTIKKRAMAIALTAILATSVILTGCTPGEKKPSVDAPSIAGDAKSSDAAKPATSGKTHDVKLIMYGESSKRMTDFCDNELKQKVKDAINVNLIVQYLPWSENEGGKTEVMLSAGEKFTTFTSTDFTSKCVSKGYFADLTESAAKYAPNLMKYCGGKEMFDCFSIDGKLYGLPFGNKPNAGENYVFMAREDLMKEFGIADLSTIKDIEDFYTKAKAKDPQMVGIASLNPETLFGALDTEMNIYRPNSFIMTDGNKPTDPSVYNFYASEEYKKLCAITADFAKKGIIPSDMLSNPQQPVSALQNGNAIMSKGASYRIFEYMTVIRKAVPDAILTNYYIGDKAKKPLMSRGTYCTAFAVGAAVEGDELDAYVKCLDLFQSSQEWNDFLLYGVEGKDYKLTETGKVDKINTDVLFDSWLVDNANFNRYPEYITDEMLATYNNWDEGCIPQKDIGFSFNMDSVKTEYAQLQAVESELLKPITFGFVDYATNIDAALKKLNDAGIEKFVAEYQKQFAAFINK